MYSTYWYTNNSYGYNPYGPYNFGSNAYPVPINAGGGQNCYNPALPGLGAGSSIVLADQYYPDGTPYKQTAEELRNYILELETNRKLENLSNVTYGGNLTQGDILFYNQATGNWEITDYLSGGTW